MMESPKIVVVVDDEEEEEVENGYHDDSIESVSEDEIDVEQKKLVSGWVEVGVVRGIPCKLHYDLAGSGPTKILFIMGYCMPRQTWQPQVEYYLQRSDEFQICTFDNRGHGGSQSSNIYTTTHTLAEDASELIEHLGWSEFHVVGLSMGGMIAQELCFVISRNRILSLTLAVTHAGGIYATGVPLSTLSHLFYWVAGINDDQRVKRFLPLCYSKKHLTQYSDVIFDWHRETYQDIRWSTLFCHMFAVFSHYLTWDRVQALRDAAFPILVLTGTEDKLVRVQNSHKLAKSLGADLKVMDGCGHLINVENPELFNHLVTSHILSAIDKRISK